MPWPTEATMRAGILFRTNGSMSGVGDLGRIGDGKSIEPAMICNQRASQLMCVQSRISQSASLSLHMRSTMSTPMSRSGEHTIQIGSWTSILTLIRMKISRRDLTPRAFKAGSRNTSSASVAISHMH